MATVPSDISSHIYSFLLRNKFVKTAKSFKKETVVVSAVFFVLFCALKAFARSTSKDIIVDVITTRVRLQAR